MPTQCTAPTWPARTSWGWTAPSLASNLGGAEAKNPTPSNDSGPQDRPGLRAWRIAWTANGRRGALASRLCPTASGPCRSQRSRTQPCESLSGFQP
eukprot:15433592-Alexandrium_andersonii.AAC.1